MRCISQMKYVMEPIVIVICAIIGQWITQWRAINRLFCNCLAIDLDLRKNNLQLSRKLLSLGELNVKKRWKVACIRPSVIDLLEVEFCCILKRDACFMRGIAQGSEYRNQAPFER